MLSKGSFHPGVCVTFLNGRTFPGEFFQFDPDHGEF